LEVERTVDTDRSKGFILRIKSPSGEMIVLDQQGAIRMQVSLFPNIAAEPLNAEVTVSVTKEATKGHVVVSIETARGRQGGPDYSTSVNKSEYDVDLPAAGDLGVAVSV